MKPVCTSERICGMRYPGPSQRSFVRSITTPRQRTRSISHALKMEAHGDGSHDMHGLQRMFRQSRKIMTFQARRLQATIMPRYSRGCESSKHGCTRMQSNIASAKRFKADATWILDRLLNGCTRSTPAWDGLARTHA